MRRLDFFRAWNAEGEAHVTVITPPEYYDVLRTYVSFEKITEIAERWQLQRSDLHPLGIGSGQAELDQVEEETFFLIVKSKNIRDFRRAVYKEYVSNGGDPYAWNPDRYYPHITIGFTRRDLHESDGVLKNAKHSLDGRFRLTWID